MADDALRAYLADRDAPCPGCGYNLRGLADDRCPECDEAIRLTVGLVEPRIGLWVAGLVGLACGLGLFGFLFVVWVITALLEGGPRAWGQHHVLGAATALPHAVATGLWMRHRPWIRCRSPRVRVLLVLVAWALPACSVAAMFVILR